MENNAKIKVIKRNGKIVDFDFNRIISAITKAMSETKQGIDDKLAKSIADDVYSTCSNRLLMGDVGVEEIQDLVEHQLMGANRPEVAKKYILYRAERAKIRNSKKPQKETMLTDEFISQYKHKTPPMTPIGQFVYYRTYSRLLPEERRREEWYETVRRAVEFNTKLAPTTREEAEKLYDNIFNLRQFVSGRTFWIGNTEVSHKYALSNFNCAGIVVDNLTAFSDLFYLLLVGAGVGVRVLRDDVAKLPKFRTDLKVIHKFYQSVPKSMRTEYTSLSFEGVTNAEIIVGDSKEGWKQSLEEFIRLMTSKQYAKVQQIIFNYDNVRPYGEALKTFGGKASGHTALQEMIQKIDKVIKQGANGKPKKLSSVDCLDIANLIGNGVVVGGVRRTAELALGDNDDKDFVSAKSNLYTQTENGWQVNHDIIHRQMSNNSLNYDKKPTREHLHWQMQSMRYSGEPGFINAEAARKRRDDFQILNPCAEILLKSNQCCNLTTVNVMSFVDKSGNLDKEGLLEAQRLSARSGFRVTCLDLELHQWDLNQKQDRLTGCSLTGWQDMVNATGLSKKEQIQLLQSLRKAAREAVDEYAEHIGVNTSLLVTTQKPEGSLSLLPTVSAGIHYSHAPYYVRRVRINASDPLLKACRDLGYPIHPEVGQTMDTASTMVVEFPVHSPEGRTKYDVTAIEQLENYKMFMEHYIDHNVSITVSVRDHEWDDVEQWLWDNWDIMVAVSFLSLDDNFYELAPYEAITKEEYESRISKMRPLTNSLISKYETFEEFEILDSDCDGGICPIR